MLQRSGLAIVGGLLVFAAFEPVALPWLLPVGVACFALATSGPTVPRAGLVGLLFGVAFYFTHIYWMKESIGPDAWLALAGIEAAFYGLLGAAMPVLRRLPAWPLWAAAAWATMETVRSTWPFSGMPWGRLSFAAVDTPTAPAVAWVGMTGLSFLLALLGAALAALVEERSRRSAGLVGAALVLLLLPALVPFEVATTGSAAVAVVQGDVPGPGNDILYDPLGVTENHVNATVDLAAQVAQGSAPAPDFVVWPENSTASDPFADSRVESGIRTAVEAIGVPILVGGMVDEGEDHVLNQGIVWDPVTGPGERYTKHHPVPYGEYIPFRDIWNPEFGQLALITRDMKSGTRTTPLQIAGTAVADAICFDVAYDDVIPTQVHAGAEMLVVQTSNASFIHTFQIEQQFAMTRLRAIEAGRWLAVASTNGRSGVIAPDGTVVATADIRTTAVLLEEVGLATGLTPAMWMGAWPARLLSVVTLGALVLGGVAYRRRQEVDSGVDPRGPAEPSEEDDRD